MSHSLPRLVKWYELKIRHTSTLLDLTRRVGVGFSLKKVILRCYIIPYQLPARFCYSSETPPPPPPSLSPLTDACRGIGAGGTFEIPLIRADTNKEVNSRVALMKCVKDAARSAPRRSSWFDCFFSYSAFAFFFTEKSGKAGLKAVAAAIASSSWRWKGQTDRLTLPRRDPYRDLES